MYSFANTPEQKYNMPWIPIGTLPKKELDQYVAHLNERLRPILKDGAAFAYDDGLRDYCRSGAHHGLGEQFTCDVNDFASESAVDLLNGQQKGGGWITDMSRVKARH